MREEALYYHGDGGAGDAAWRGARLNAAQNEAVKN